MIHFEALEKYCPLEYLLRGYEPLLLFQSGTIEPFIYSEKIGLGEEFSI